MPRVVPPESETGPGPFRQTKADRAINVITIKMNFRPSGFERPVTEHFKEQILSKLAEAGIASLTVIITKGPRGDLALHFEGAEDDVTKAKAAFG